MNNELPWGPRPQFRGAGGSSGSMRRLRFHSGTWWSAALALVSIVLIAMSANRGASLVRLQSAVDTNLRRIMAIVAADEAVAACPRGLASTPAAEGVQALTRDLGRHRAELAAIAGDDTELHGPLTQADKLLDALIHHIEVTPTNPDEATIHRHESIAWRLADGVTYQLREATRELRRRQGALSAALLEDRFALISLIVAAAAAVAIAGLLLHRAARAEMQRGRVAERLARDDAFRAAIIQHAAEGLCVCHAIPEPPFVRFTVWNNRMTEITGYTMEEINQRGWYQTVYTDPEAREQARQRMERMRAGDDLVAEEWEITRADGARRTLLISTTRLAGDDGAGHVLALMNDITDRKRAEAALRESEERLRATLDNTPGVAVQWYDREGRVLYWNPASEKLYGFSAAQAVGKTLDELIQTRQQMQEFLRELHEIERTRQPFGPTEIAVTRRDGTTCYVLYTLFVIPGGDQGPIFVCMDLDITARKRAEEDLRISEERFHVFMDNSPMIAFYKDADGRMLYVNPALQRTFHISDRDWLGKTDAELWPPEVADQLRRNDLRILETGRSEALEERVVHADGTHTWLVHKFRFFDSAGNRFLGGLGIDLTDRKRLEERLLQAEKLESIGRLAGGVAHDFNNVLTAIIGSVEVAEARLEPANPAKAELDTIRLAAERATDLTRQLLAFARRQVIEPTNLNLNAIIAEVSPMLRRLIGENIQLVVRGSPSLGAVHADRGQIEQILVNVSVNARDAMPGGGTLTIETDNVDVAGEPSDAPSVPPPGGYVLLSVLDEGVGISEEQKQHIFEPFFTTKGVGGGTGLGLATVYGIIQQANGFITVASDPGKGACFRMYFPRVEAAPPPPVPVRPAAVARGGGETVLVVEDEPLVRDIAVTSLRNAGYRVISAADGDEALRVAAAHPGEIHALVCDVVLPGRAGSIVAQRLRDSRPRMRVLFVSGYADDALVHQHVLRNDVQFLQKPYAPTTLAQKVREVLESGVPDDGNRPAAVRDDAVSDKLRVGR